MPRERVIGRWIDCFAEVFGKCGARPGELVAIPAEVRSRPISVEPAAWSG